MAAFALTGRELEELVATLATGGRDAAGAPARGVSPLKALSAPVEPAAILEVRKLASLIDHTLLRPDATHAQVERLCHEALQFGFAVACVNPFWVPTASKMLQVSDVRVGTVVGFPLGATTTSAKRAEARAAILAGAREIDMVMNVGTMKSGDLARVQIDIRGVVEICHAAGVIVKVILENAYLTDAEKTTACQIVKQTGADFVKTSTGFGPSGATEADVRLMRQAVGPAMGVKAAGGIRTLADALGFLRAGANRLGTSAGVNILVEAAQRVS